MGNVITEKQLLEILASNKNVLIDFYSLSCGPCRMLLPVVSEIEKEEAEWLKVVKIDVDANRELAAKFQIRVIPTLIVVVDNEIKEVSSGYRPKEQVLEFVRKHVK